MQKILSLVTIISLISCSDPEPFDPQLQEFIIEFISEAEARGIKTTEDKVNKIQWLWSEDLGTLVAGKCRRRTLGHNRITLNSFYWKDAEWAQRYYVIFHELGHAVFDKEHPEPDFGGIMSNNFNWRNLYNEEERQYFLNEFFNEVK